MITLILLILGLAWEADFDAWGVLVVASKVPCDCLGQLVALKRTFGSVFLGQQISFPNSNFGYKSTPPQPGPVYGSKTYIWEGFPAAANRPSNFEFRTQKYPPAAWTSLWFQNVHLGGFSCSSKSAIQIRGSDTITHPQSGLVSLKKYI